MEGEHRLAAIMSADVAGYSRLMSDDEEATVGTLKACRELVAERVAGFRGRVVDFRGDDFLAEFPSAVDAVFCATEIQRALGGRNAELPEHRRMSFRIGIHLGDVRVEGDRIYGDGVNIASRLEALSGPGGICISDMVHALTHKKLGLEWEELGERRLKNIPEPVRVFRLQDPIRQRRADPARHAAAFGTRPAIGVLSFENASPQGTDDYFAAGISEDLVARLSSWRSFRVVLAGRADRARPVSEIGEALGVRYLLSGSARRSEDRVRIVAEVVESPSGDQVWAGRFDRELGDVFALQDEIAEAIVGAVHPELWRFERERVAYADPADLGAWDAAQRGWWHLEHYTREQSLAARPHFERALESDPQLVTAHYGLAMSHYYEVLNGWTRTPETSIAATFAAAQRAVEADERNPLGHLALGCAYGLSGPIDKAVASFEIAVELNPSSTWGRIQLATHLALGDRSERGLEVLESVGPLDAKDPLLWSYRWAHAIVNFHAERYEEAAIHARRCLQQRPHWRQVTGLLASACGYLGLHDEARTLFSRPPEPERIRLALRAAAPEVIDRTVEGLRRAFGSE